MSAILHFLQIGVVIAWPAFGVALMESLTEWRTPIVEVRGVGQESSVVVAAMMHLEHTVN